MIQTQITIVQKETIAPAWWRFNMAGPELASHLLPGQFLLLRCADRFTCYLRRPVYPGCGGQSQFSLLLLPETDAGLAWLATRMVGDTLDVIGPLGVGFPLARNVRNLLLISDSQAIGPLLGQMERAVAAGVTVTLALGGNRASTIYPATALPPVVEFYAATLDGSLGHRGLVIDLLSDLLLWADAICAVGSLQLYRTLKNQVEAVRFMIEPGFLYGLVNVAPLACGLGACLGCSVETEAGLRLACSDGPVFDLAELSL